MATMTQARDDVFTMLTDAWAANASFGSPPYVPEIRYTGTVEGALPAASICWARLSLVHATGSQTSFGAIGNRRFERRGILMFQLFTPVQSGQGLSSSESLATIARNAWEGLSSPNGVWFRNIRVQDIGIDGPWWNTNVLGSFLYDEVK